MPNVHESMSTLQQAGEFLAAVVGFSLDAVLLPALRRPV
jgi:hypothetical protein